MATSETPIDKTINEIDKVITQINMGIMRLAQLQARMEKQYIARVAAYKAHLTMAKKRESYKHISIGYRLADHDARRKPHPGDVRPTPYNARGKGRREKA